MRRGAAAVAVLVLAVLTGCAGSGEPGSGRTGAGESTAASTRASSVPATPTAAAPTPVAAPKIPAHGSGKWQAVHKGSKARGKGRRVDVAVRVESNLPIDGAEATGFIMATLRDKRSWQQLDGVRFALVPKAATADVVVNIASPDTTDRMCLPLNTVGKLSCRNGRNVIFNARRWVGAAKGFGSLTQYRQYLVNHEVGHALGHGHAYCGGKGRTAPLMMQQTKGLHGCKPNGWPAVK